MRTLMALGLILALAPASLGAREAEVKPAVRVVEQLVESMGGEAALKKITGLKAMYKGTYKAGSMESAYTSENTCVLPDRLIWKLVTPGFSGSMGVNGEASWTHFMCPPARCRGFMDDMVREWIRQHELLLAYPLLYRDDVELTRFRTDWLADGGHHHIKVVFDGKHEFVLVVEVLESGKAALISTSGNVTHETGETGTFEARYSEPKDFGGIVLPSKSHIRYFSGKQVSAEMAEETVSIEWNPELAEGYFAVPAPGELDKPFLNDIRAYSGLVLVHTGPYDRMGETIEKAVGVCDDLKLSRLGPKVAIFIDDPMSVADHSKLRTEIVIPVQLMGTPPEKLPEGATIRNFEAMKVAAMRVRGEYGTVEQKAFPALAMWVGKNGHGFAGPPRIIYFHNPKGILPEDQASEVQIPIRESQGK